MPFDFNKAGRQRSFDPIPAGTVVGLQVTVRRGDAGEDGWLRRAKDGASEGLDLEFTVLSGGPFVRRKFWQHLTLGGTREGHAKAAEINQAMLRAMLESANRIRPDDVSETANQARRVESYSTFNGLCFTGEIGVEPARNGFGPKNILLRVITPDMPEWGFGSSDTTAKAPPSVGRPSWVRER